MPDQEADGHVVSDPELITRVRTGDREAYGELYRRHAGAATTLARQFARSAAESDDLVSESFARVLDNLLAGKGPDTAFRAYLFTSIRNTAYDRTRKDKRLQFTDDMTTHDVAVVGDDPVLAKMESGLVAAAFAQLPERWQAVLWHTQVEGESPATVGALLGMAPGAVSSLAFRAREGLREAYLQAHLAETAAEQCRTTVERLGAWTRGGLSKREKIQVDAHLEECERCRALAAELAEVNHGLRGVLAPLLLGGAAAGYLATLGPVAPLIAPGALIAGTATMAGGSGAATGSTGGAVGAGAAAGGSAGGAATATGAVAAGSGAAAAGGGAAGAGTAAAAAAAGGVGAGTAAGVGATAGGLTAAAAASGVAAVGLAATANASSGATAGGAGVGTAAGVGTGTAAGVGGTTAGVGGAAAAVGTGTAAGVGGTAAGVGGAAAGVGSAAAGAVGVTAAGVGGASAASSGLAGVLAAISVGGLIKAGAAVVVAVAATVAIVVSNTPSDTTNAGGQPPSASAVATTAASPELTDGAVATVPGADGTDTAAPDQTAGNDTAPPTLAGTSQAAATDDTGPAVPIVDTPAPVAAPPTDITEATTDAPTTDAPSTDIVEPPPIDSSTPVTDTPTDSTTPTSEPTTDSTSSDSTTPLPAPADLSLSAPAAGPLTAGGAGTVTFTVSNTGGSDSTTQPVTIAPPPAHRQDGIQITDVQVNPPASALRAQRSRLQAAPTGNCDSAVGAACSVDLPAVAAGSSVTVTATLYVTPGADSRDNAVTITVQGQQTELPLPTISAGIGSLTTDTDDPLVTGRVTDVVITPSLTDPQIEPGPITFDSTSDGVTFAPSASCPQGTHEVTCDLGPNNTLTLSVAVASGQHAGPLGVTASDAGGRALSLFTSNGGELSVVRHGELTVSDLTITDTPVAGGSGTFSAFVRNDGVQDSAAAAIDLTLPAGVRLSSVIVPGGQTCSFDTGAGGALAVGDPCEVPPLAPDAGVLLQFLVVDTPDAATGAAVLSVGDADPLPFTLPVQTGVAALVGSPDTLLADGTKRSVTISISPAPGVTDPGPVTLTSDSSAVTLVGTSSCQPQADQHSVTCTGEATLGVIISSDQPAGVLPVSATDAGGRSLQLTDGNGGPLQVVAATPAALNLTDLAVRQPPLVAGATGALTLTAGNTGDLPSTPERLTVAVPDGMSLAGVTAAGSPTEPAVDLCQQGAGCELPAIPGHGSLALTVTLDVAPGTAAAPGEITISVPDATAALTPAVATGIGSLVAQVDGPLSVGSTSDLPVRITPVAAGVSPGPVTFTSTSTDVTFGPAAGCTTSGDGSATTCDPGDGYSMVPAIAVGDQQLPGDLPVSVTDAGGRPIEMLAASGGPVQVAVGRIDLSDLTVLRSQSPGVTVLRLTVSNPGAISSEPAPITVRLSKGFTLGSIVGADPARPCTLLVSPTCTLQPIAAGDSRTLDFYLGSDLPVYTGTATVTINATTKSVSFVPTSATDQAGTLDAQLAAGAGGSTNGTGTGSGPPGPLPAGTGAAPSDPAQPSAAPTTDPATRDPATSDPATSAPDPDTSAPGSTVTEPTGSASDPATASTEPAPSTVLATPATPVPTTAAPTAVPTTTAATSTAASKTTTSSTTATTSPAVPAVTATTATTATSPPSTTSTPVDPTSGATATTTLQQTTPTSLPPAALVLSNPTVEQIPSRGGTGRFAVTVTNVGGRTSAEQSVRMDLPSGVELAAVTVDGAPTGLAGSRSAALPAIDPGSSVTVVVAISVSRDAPSGTASATINGRTVHWALPITR